MPYETIEPGDLVVLDPDGDVVEGRNAPSSERLVHLAIYAARDDVRAIVHTHSPRAVRWSDLGEPLPFDGGAVPTAAYALTGTEELATNAVARAGRRRPRCCSAGHGVVAVGATVEEARAVAERIEAAAGDAWQHRERRRGADRRQRRAAGCAATDADARLAFARRPLVIGIGGGGDVAGALAVAEMSRLYHGGDPIVGGVTWERRPIDPEPGPRRVDEIDGAEPPRAVRADGRTGDARARERRALRRVAHGRLPARGHAADRPERRAAQGRRRRWPRRATGSATDLTIFVDVGGDVLAHGDERGLASPLCDSVMLAAAVRMQRAGHPVLGAVFGVGLRRRADARRGVGARRRGGGRRRPGRRARADSADRRAPRGGGPPRPTEASAQALKAFRGETGVSTMRGGRRSVELSPAARSRCSSTPRPRSSRRRAAPRRSTTRRRSRTPTTCCTQHGRRADRARLGARPAAGV